MLIVANSLRILPTSDVLSAPSIHWMYYLLWSTTSSVITDSALYSFQTSAGVGRTGTFICLDQLCQQVRYYLQPNFQPILLPNTASTRADEEPIYANLNGDSDEPGARTSLRMVDGGDTDMVGTGTVSSPRLSKTPSDSDRTLSPTHEEDESSGRQTLLFSSGNRISSSGRTGWSLGKMRRFGLGRKKTHCINVYKTVLWLRSHRSYMVQSEVSVCF